MSPDDLILEALRQPLPAIAYSLSKWLAELFPEQAIVEGSACTFDPVDFASSGQCSLVLKATAHSQVETQWEGEGEELSGQPANVWFEVTFKQRELNLLILSWQEGFHTKRHCWVIAESQKLAEEFFALVTQWSADQRAEVLVFSGGEWQKDRALFKSIRDARFDNLVLAPGLKEEIAADVQRFFASRDRYESYGIPWKRGLLFVGPPGNGKTHAVKAVINVSGQRCIYAKSFACGMMDPPQATIAALFRRVRRSTPCILVFEDLDSLITDQSRAFFLNELDGFASNAGIFTVATTNHPERLDAAILERPSRFDRKYRFSLPAIGEREAFLAMWNQHLDPALRLSESELRTTAVATEGFSFAFLKELFLSATMCWIDHSEGQRFATAIDSVRQVLQTQITREPGLAAAPPSPVMRWFAGRLASLRAALQERGFS